MPGINWRYDIGRCLNALEKEMSSLKAYDDARETAAKAKTELDALTKKLEAVIKGLKLSPVEMLLRPQINYPVENDPKRLRIDSPDPEDRTVLDEMPDPEIIRGALIKLRNAEAEVKKAFDALDEVEKKYVRNAQAGERR
jgi:hypothetical protein